jgi:hypothetical protein
MNRIGAQGHINVNEARERAGIKNETKTGPELALAFGGQL